MLRGLFSAKNPIVVAGNPAPEESADLREMHSICCFTDFGHSSADWAMFVNLDTRRVYACICNSSSKRLRIHKSTSWLELDVLAAEKWLDFAGKSNSHVPHHLFKYFPDQFWQKNDYQGDRFHAYALMRILQLEEPTLSSISADKIIALVAMAGLGLLTFNWWFKLIDMIFTLKHFG